MENQIKHLYRSRKNRVFAGVIGGVAEYFNVDASLLRLIFILALFLTAFFPLFFAYIVSAIVIPRSPE